MSNFRGSEIDEFRVGPGIRKRRRLLALATAKLLKLAKPRHTHTQTQTHTDTDGDGEDAHTYTTRLSSCCILEQQGLCDRRRSCAFSRFYNFFTQQLKAPVLYKSFTEALRFFSKEL